MTDKLKPPTNGLCVGKTDLFYLPPFRTKESMRKENEAKILCRVCPQQKQCLEYALHHEAFGIWGGLSERARRMMRKEMGITVEKIELDNIVR